MTFVTAVYNSGRRRGCRSRCCAMPVLILALLLIVLPRAVGQSNIQGQWTTLPYTMPINPIHAALLNTGKVLVIAGSGNYPSNLNFQAAVWDPASGSIATQPVTWDMFCNGMVVLPDGRPFVNGGNLQYDPFRGLANTSVFDPATGSFTDLPNMAHGRWYPTATVLADGTIMTFSGLDETGATNSTVEIFTPGSNSWSPSYPAGWIPPLYPRLHVLPNGNVFYSGPGIGSRYFTPSTHTWTKVVATTNYTNARTYGTSVLLPLTPVNNYRPVVMIMGGGVPTATATAELFDLSAATPSWQPGPAMSQARVEMNAVILPTGKVVALGGSGTDENASTASFNADLYDPASNSFSSAGANAFPRLYHSIALLLPDATVWVAGGNPQRGTYESHMEIYQPAYLFSTDSNGNPMPAPRPTITSAPGAVGYGTTFTVESPDSFDISSVVLVKAGSVTHAFDMEQRLVGLSYTAGSGSLTVTAPPNPNIAPPGYYLLFLLNSSGVPSVANFVRIAPVSVSVNPNPASVVAGGSEQFSATVQNAADTTVTWQASNGSITPGGLYTAPSAVPATPLTVTAISNADGTSSASATIQVTDFNLSLPKSVVTTITAGQSANTTVTITPINGFSEIVSLSCGGLPSGANCMFSPDAIGIGSGSSSSALVISTTVATPPGTYTVIITGASQDMSRPQPFTLQVLQACAFMLDSTSQSFTSASSNGTVGIAVTAGIGCNWSATSNTSWIAITSPDSGSGNGIVTYSITANSTSTQRSGTLGIAGLTFTVTQSPAVMVSISPVSASTQTGGAQLRFTATVSNTSNLNVDWSVSGRGCNNGPCGTINTAGVYTPVAHLSAPQVDTIVAASQVDGNLSNAAQVTVFPPPLVQTPPPASVASGQVATYPLSLNGKTGDPTQPLTLLCKPGTLPPGGACNFSAPTITPGPSAVNFTLTITTKAASAGITRPRRGQARPLVYAAFLPLMGMVLLGAASKTKRSICLFFSLVCLSLALVGCGGGGASPLPPPDPGITYDVVVQGTPITGSTVDLTTATLTVR